MNIAMAGFKQEHANKLLVECHRRCCICHRFCGVKMEIDHITQSADGGPDDIENGIAVCFECHAEIHSYNDKHPRGRKYRAEELLRHKQQWLEICRLQPQLFDARSSASVGPLQALIDELEFNMVVAQHASTDLQGCLFMDRQFKKAIQEGAIAVLQDDLKHSLNGAYRFIGRANQHITSVMHHPINTPPWDAAVSRARTSIRETEAPIKTAH